MKIDITHAYRSPTINTPGSTSATDESPEEYGPRTSAYGSNNDSLLSST